MFGGRGRGLVLELVSLPLLLLIWQIWASLAAYRLFPTPVAVAEKIWDLATTGPLLLDFGKTLLRSAIGFVAGMVIGTALGVLLGRVRALDRLFSAWIFVSMNLPALVIGIVFYIWLGLTEFALVLAVVVNKVPLVVTTVREGVRNLSPEFDELARAYRLPLARRLRLVVWPQLVPFVLAAARTGLSLIWKIVLVFEILGSDGGVGFRIHGFFQFFDMTSILAYTVAFIIVVLALEYGVTRPLERHVLRWRADQR